MTNLAVFSWMPVQPKATVYANETDISVVTSFYPVYEFTKKVVGDRADITLLVDGSIDPHGYEPSAQDVIAVNNADIFIYSNNGMEFWVETLLNNIENDDLVIVNTTEGVLSNQETSKEENGPVVVKIEDVAEHYHTGEQLSLTVELTEEVPYEHWHWYSRSDDSHEWEVIPGQGTQNLDYTLPKTSFELKAVLFDNEHHSYAESEVVKIVVDNHEDHSHAHEQDGDNHDELIATDGIVINGLANHYHTGDVVRLQAKSSEKVDSWQWKIRYEGQGWEIVSEQTSDIFEYEASGGNFEVQAVAVDSQGNVTSESEPVVAHIDNHDDLDPHIWLDPVLAKDQVNHIRNGLIEVDPEGADYYTHNAIQFNEELQQLHEEFEAAFEGAKNRIFIVQHQAFGYLANRYDLEQIAVGGLSTEVEPSPARIAEIVRIVEETNAKVIYFQQGTNSIIAQTIATETGIEIAALHDLEILSEELRAKDLGYLEAMRENIEALKLSIQ